MHAASMNWACGVYCAAEASGILISCLAAITAGLCTNLSGTDMVNTPFTVAGTKTYKKGKIEMYDRLPAPFLQSYKEKKKNTVIAVGQVGNLILNVLAMTLNISFHIQQSV